MSTTTTTMPASTRAHLVRSTRKLAHILGTTPSATVNVDSDTDSVRSFSSYRLRKKPSITPASLFVGSPPSTVEFEVALPLTPSPVTPDFAHEEEQADKRRRFAKVCRTLGENVPPELVFGMPPTYHKPTHRRRGSSLSHIISFSRNAGSARASTTTASSREVPVHPSTPVIPQSDEESSDGDDSTHTSTFVHGGPGWEGQWNRQSMGEVRMRLRQLK